MHLAALSFLLFAVVAHAATVERFDSRLDALLAWDAPVERLVDGLRWVEGPVWNRQDHYLLFSDVPANRIYRFREGETLRVFREPSGYTLAKAFTGAEPGSNGLAYDREHRLVVCQHGDRRIVRVEPDGSTKVLVDRYRGKRLNSPNDLVYASSGDLYFTDPPFGLPATFDDPEKELAFSGVYRLAKSGAVELLVDELKAPNGIALSPDERTLYVTDVDPSRPAWLAYSLDVERRVVSRRVLYDASHWTRSSPGAPDGIEVDISGHVFGAGPGGVYVFTPAGELLGRIALGVPTGNVAWGDDGTSLYITASSALYRVRTRTRSTETFERHTNPASQPQRGDPT